MDASAVPPSSSSKISTTGDALSPPKCSKMSVSDFVSASFARFEAEYGSSTFEEVGAGTEASRLLASRHADKVKSLNDNKYEDQDEKDFEDENEPFWSLILTLYLPILVFSLRRSTFGTFSFIRTFLLGHVLRLLISVVLFSIPTSFTKRFDRWWGKFTQIYWIQHVLWAMTGEERFHPGNHQLHVGSQYYNDGVSPGGLGAVTSVNSRKHPDQVWPPPALTLLTLITVVAFVVHPDGLTWIIIGKALDGMLYLIQLAAAALVMLRDEPIYTIAAATSLTGIVLLGGVIHKTLSPKTNRSQVEDGCPSGSSRKSKKSKKGKHGRNCNHNTRGRGKVRGGHFRSAKDLYDSPTRTKSRSPSLHNEDIQKNELEVSENKNTLAHSGAQEGNQSKEHLTRNSHNPTEYTESQAVNSQSHSSLSKLRPYSVDLSLPQLSDDVSSCSSITGSLIDVPGSKPLKSVLDDVDKKANRLKTKNQKRGKNTSVTGTQSLASQTSTSRASSGFIGNDPAMTPSPVSPLTFSNSSQSPYNKRKDASSISPVRKAISRPLSHKTDKTNNRTQAIAGDRREKQLYSAPLPTTYARNNASTGKMPLQSQPINQPPGNVRWDIPDYSAYAQSDSRYDPKKIELAAFLARVGLVGSACADLLRDLLDVDALASLTTEELYMYRVGDEKQMEIAALLKARELHALQQRRQKMPQKSVHTSSRIRPPPGLGFASPTLQSGGAPLQMKPVKPIAIASPQTRSFTPVSTSKFLLSSPMPSVNSSNAISNFTLQSLRSSNDNSMVTGNTSDPLIQSSFQQNISSQPLPIGSRPFLFTNRSEHVQTEDEKIDADLQQLGDRMAGSILDF